MISLEIGVASQREHKGKSILDSIDNYTVLDVETTGLDPFFNDIIEIGLVRVRGGNIADSFEALVNPGYKIDDFISELTGITNSMLADAPSIDSVLPSALAFIENDVIVAHNANFDVNFVYDNCLKMKLKAFSNDFIDTMRLSRRLFPGFQHHRLKDLIERFEIGDVVDHRALKDSIQTHACYEYMKRHITADSINLNDLLKHKNNWSSKDIGADKTDFDESSPVFGKCFVFTGTLEKMKRKDAMQTVVDAGGTCGDSVTKKTNYLVLGNNDYCSTIKGGKSSKQKKAESMKLAGCDIEILSENVFYDMIAQIDFSSKEVDSKNSTNDNNADIVLSEDEKEAFDYVCEALSEINVGREKIHPERRTENYLSIVSDEGHDFCRVKFSKNSKWISLSMWNVDEEIKNDPFFASVTNKNARHWKISLNWTGDLLALYDIIQISYISDHKELP